MVPNLPSCLLCLLATMPNLPPCTSPVLPRNTYYCSCCPLQPSTNIPALP